ncbi:MAG: hypothetical protein QW578_06990, partial [Thermoplasmatales archaeon]
FHFLMVFNVRNIIANNLEKDIKKTSSATVCFMPSYFLAKTYVKFVFLENFEKGCLNSVN